MNKIIFGLGNPGNFYKHTRHNLGAIIINDWWVMAKKENLSRVEIIDLEFQMNESGNTLIKKLKNKSYESKDILVAHDDIELAFGEVELVLGGSAKGHNGVRSIYDILGTQDIQRLRIGIGRPPEDVEVRDFVLSNFTANERLKFEKMQNKANELIDKFVEA